MDNYSFKEAMSNTSIDQPTLKKEELQIIEEALKEASDGRKSFFTCLYQKMEEERKNNGTDKSK